MSQKNRTYFQDLTGKFIPYMPSVAESHRRFNSLGDAWDQIKRLAEVTCRDEAKIILSSMENTQQGFQDLTEKLIPRLIQEEINKVVLEITSKAQVTVDILIRNLFERTADVGFLATDNDIVGFLLNKKPDPEDIRAITKLLEEYRAKYTVYDEIVVLDSKGNVRAHLDEKSQIIMSSDALIPLTLKADKYIETFRKSDLRPNQDRALIYSHKIIDPKNSENIGILCLCFRFEDEMKGIFKNLRREGDRSAMLLLDKSGTVIASSDTNHIRIGETIEMVINDPYKIVEFGGRDYIAKTCPTKGYQEYMGLGWYGHVMIACDQAFKSTTKILETIDKEILEGIMTNSQSFSPELKDIVTRAASINLSLKRVVWNGQIMARDEASNLKAVLRQISKTGNDTSNEFRGSIHNLHATIIGSSLDDVKFMSGLAVDIMDRNLYERANDCRWWALASAFRRIMSQQEISNADIQEMTSILQYINSLYTVYTRIFVYDRDGKIIAASNLNNDDVNIVGKKLDIDFVRRTLEVKTTKDYVVSAFENSELYGDKHTYIYNAAIRHHRYEEKVVGGIGIVFDSEPQFEAMLKDCLPPKKDIFGVFTDRWGRVISSSNPDFAKIGSKLDLEDEFFQHKNGERVSKIIKFRGSYYTIGSTTSFGYREYKTNDNYNNDIIAFVFVRLGEVQSECHSQVCGLQGPSVSGHGHGTGKEFACFYVGGLCYGIEVELVQEALGLEMLTGQLPCAESCLAGMVNFRGMPIPVFDTRVLFDTHRKEIDIYNQVIVVKINHQHNGETISSNIGFLVDEIHDVLEIPQDRVIRIDNDTAKLIGVTKFMIKPIDGNDSNRMLPILDPERMFILSKESTRTKRN